MGFARAIAMLLAVVLGAILLIPAVLVAAPFLAVSALIRLAGTRKERRAATGHWQRLVEYEPVVGWKPLSNLDVDDMADEVFRLTTGPDGWRGSTTLAEADMVVFGDSFAFGQGAADDAMYTRFCRGIRVKPIGANGYSMVHGALWMRRLAPQLAGKVVVWFVYYGNDLHESVLPNMGRYRMPFVREDRGTGKWEIVTDHVSPEPWPFSSSRTYHEMLAEICCATRSGRRILSAADFLIREAAQTCREAGAELIVVGIPMSVQLSRRGQAQLAGLAPDRETFDVGRPDQVLQASCEAMGVPFIPLSAHLKAGHYLLKDIHWTPAGHRRVGALLTDVYEQHRSRSRAARAA